MWRGQLEVHRPEDAFIETHIIKLAATVFRICELDFAVPKCRQRPPGQKAKFAPFDPSLRICVSPAFVLAATPRVFNARVKATSFFLSTRPSTFAIDLLFREVLKRARGFRGLIIRA